MLKHTDTRILGYEPLESPVAVRQALPTVQAAENTVVDGRATVSRLLHGDDNRMLVVVGPCSIHDSEVALDYARRLDKLRQELAQQLVIVMRVYFEKPRTTVGWKGMINDPGLDGTCDMNSGLRQARQLLLDINALGLPCATEFLDPIVPQYTSDLISWAAVGARTTESQTHREMASGLSMPVGFKNATDGSLDTAAHAMEAARQEHSFLGVSAEGQLCVVRTRGNGDVHVVLRGGARPNYNKPHIEFAKAALDHLSLARPILVDCSHDNSQKDYTRQGDVFTYLVGLVAQGEKAIVGGMLESNLVAGKQDLSAELTYGQSITDACIGWEETEALLRLAAHQLGCA